MLPGHDENFNEWASGRLLWAQATVNFRPTDRMRLGFTYLRQQVNRRTDGSLVSLAQNPRLKLEYQVSRPLFVRLVGEYDSQQTDSLRDDSRTGGAILYYDPATGSYSRAGAVQNNRFRGDFLVAYQPSPGTVLFAGYGGSYTDPRAFRFRGLQRTTDGFFVKLSYLWRM